MRVLFVDDEPNILGALQRILRPMKDKWDMEFKGSGAAALESAAREPFDIVVSDMKMPGMDGAQLLSEIRRHHPETIRIALSGQTDSNMIYRCVQHAHQYIAKPCDIDTLLTTVNRIHSVSEMLKDKNLIALVSKISALPTLPEHYQSIMQELQSSEPSLQKVAEIVESDIAMTAKILQLVNSAYFGLVRHVSSPAEATMFLGVDVVKSLVLTCGVFDQFENSSLADGALQRIWSHSIRVGPLAKEIALAETNDTLLGDYAFMGGLLAGVGKLILATSFPAEYSRVEEILQHDKRPDWQVEREVLGYSHMEVGAYLTSIWGLPNPVVECVAYQRFPHDCVEPGFSPMSAVHIANAIVNASDAGVLADLDHEYVESLEVADKMDEWQALYLDLDKTDSETDSG